MNDGAMQLQGKNLLISGMANERSLASAVARAAHQAGARIIATCQEQRQRERVRALLEDAGEDSLVLQCDVQVPEQLAALQQSLQEQGVRLDGMLHAIAYGRLQDGNGAVIPLLETSSADFSQALQVSAHSLSLLCRSLLPHLNPSASIVALTYAGATQVKSGYNLMGVAKAALEAEIRYLAAELGPQQLRVNGVSAPPVRTVAARHAPGFNERLAAHPERSLLGRSISADEIANCVCFLFSDQSSALNGEIIFADGGAHLRG